MDRRDLLKRAGTLVMGLPALRASSLANSLVQSGGKYLVVTFSGPFCFWADAKTKKYTVMAPLVGLDFKCPGDKHSAAHQAWAATSQNEIILNSESWTASPEYELQIPGDRSPKISGTTPYRYAQEGPAGKQTLFTLSVPNPDEIIGIHPTMVNFESPRAAAQSGLLAAGLTFVYKDVDGKKVMLTQRNGSKPSSNLYQPCFDNDATLPAATLGIHLSRVVQRQNGHEHANCVWGKMEEMYPWMEKTTVKFPPFDPSRCPPGPGPSAIGPGNDCEVPIMLLGGN